MVPPDQSSKPAINLISGRARAILSVCCMSELPPRTLLGDAAICLERKPAAPEIP
jgi:hypothetical protein